MNGNTFAVVFSGRVANGASVEQVKSNVAKLFKVEVAKVERLFSGARVAIKKGLDEATAKKYQMALAKAGALCEVINVAAAKAPPTKAPAKPAAPKPVAPVARPEMTAKAKPATRGRHTPGLTKDVVKEAPGGLGDFANVKLDAPGVVLVKHQDVAPLQVDLRGLSMDQPGVVLGEHKEEAPLRVDLSGISMAEPGADIGKTEEVPDLAVDLSGLSMDEPGATLVEHAEVPEPRIDTSRLSVS